MSGQRIGYSYTRFSSDKQSDGDSQRRQDADAEDYAEAQGITLDTTLNLRDRGLSAYSSQHRLKGALGTFLAAIETKRIAEGSILIVEAIDRLTREHPLDAYDLIGKILRAKIEIHTVEDGEQYTWASLDNGQMPRLADKIEQARAYSRRLSRRLAKAWGQKKVETGSGIALTAMCPPWLRKVGKGYEVIPHRAAIIQRIFEETRAGLGSIVITRRLNEEGVAAFDRVGQGLKGVKVSTGWHPSYISKTIPNRAVLGEYQPYLKNTATGGKRVPFGDAVALYPAIIDADLFEKANAAKDGRRGKGGRKGKLFANILTGMTICATCNGPMTFRAKGKRHAHLDPYNILVCNGAARGSGCTNHTSFRYEPIETAVLDMIDRFELSDPSMFCIAGSNVAVIKAASIRDTISRKKLAMDNLWNTFAEIMTKDVAIRIHGLSVEIEAMQEELAVAERDANTASEANLRSQMSAIKNLRAVAQSKTFDDQRYQARAQIHQAIGPLIHHIILDPTDKKAFVALTEYSLTFEVSADGTVDQVCVPFAGGVSAFFRDGQPSQPEPTPHWVLNWQKAKDARNLIAAVKAGNGA